MCARTHMFEVAVLNRKIAPWALFLSMLCYFLTVFFHSARTDNSWQSSFCPSRINFKLFLKGQMNELCCFLSIHIVFTWLAVLFGFTSNCHSKHWIVTVRPLVVAVLGGAVCEGQLTLVLKPNHMHGGQSRWGFWTVDLVAVFCFIWRGGSHLVVGEMPTFHTC